MGGSEKPVVTVYFVSLSPEIRFALLFAIAPHCYLVLPLDPEDTTQTVVDKRLYLLHHLDLSAGLRVNLEQDCL